LKLKLECCKLQQQGNRKVRNIAHLIAAIAFGQGAASSAPTKKQCGVRVAIMPDSDPARQVHVWDQEGAFYGQDNLVFTLAT
jgi:hypothetical protein